MECLPVTTLPDGQEWAFEIKFDGYRALAVKADSKVRLYSRRKKSFNSQYPHLVAHLIQQFRKESSRIHYFTFDLLVCKEPDLTALPLSQRRELLRELVKPNARIRISEQFEVSANEMLLAVGEQKLEGGSQAQRQSLPGQISSEPWTRVCNRRVHSGASGVRFVDRGFLPRR